MRRQLSTLLFAGLALAASVAQTDDFHIDQVRSHADFGVRLLWVHTVTGRFTDIQGDVNLDRSGMATVDVRIGVDSVAMGSARFRRWVLAPEFFDAARHPSARFLSDPVPFNRLVSGGILDGQLSLRGITRPIRLELLPADCATITARAWAWACTIEARGVVSRSDFGMTSHGTSLSDQVHLDLLIALDPTPE
ncbi:MAG: YceI family protein [Rhodanobacter sp.]